MPGAQLEQPKQSFTVLTGFNMEAWRVMMIVLGGISVLQCEIRRVFS